VTTTVEGRIPWASPVLRIALASTLVGVLDVTLVSPLLPAIADRFGVGPARASLVITAYTLPGIALSPVAGALADRYGRRPVLAGSLTLFACCGTAVLAVQNFDALLLLRAGQGVAAGGLFSVSVTLLGDAFEGAERTAVLGLNAAVIAVGATVYPLVGGWLGAVSWQAPFALYAVGLPVAVWVVRGLADPPATTAPEGGLAYVRNSLRELPRRAAATVFSALFGAYVLLFGAVFTAVPFLLAGSGLSAVAIGAVISASALTGAVVALSSGRLAAVSPYRRIGGGFCAYGVGVGTVALAPSPPAIALGAVVVGAGQGAVLPAIDGRVSDLVSRRYRAGVVGLRTSVVSLGATVGPVGFTVAAARLGSRPTLLVGGCVALVGGLALLWRGDNHIHAGS
jgi:MFS family permease